MGAPLITHKQYNVIQDNTKGYKYGTKQRSEKIKTKVYYENKELIHKKKFILRTKN